MYRKPLFWLVLLCITGLTAASIGLLGGTSRHAELTEEDYARQYIDRNIKQYQSEWPDVRIIDSKIITFEKTAEFDNLLAAPLQIWRLEFRLTPDDPVKLMLPGGMQAVDGLITEDGSMGKPMLVFSYQDSVPEYLGEVWSGENDLTRPAGQEMALRKFFEGKGQLPHETFSGSHILVKFSLTSGETSQLLLSQPGKKGDQGIWAVERWKDTRGNEYYYTPKTEKTLSAYYASLQTMADQGTDKTQLDPQQVAIQYIKSELGQPVSRDKLVMEYQATAADFAVSPESSLMGYVTDLALDSDTMNFDQVEWLTLEDKDRMKSLNITEDQMPGGFYILNKYAVNDPYKLTAETQYKLIDRDNPGSLKSVSKQEFIEYFNQFTGFAPPCSITVSNYAVHIITEQYVP